ncbi:MAG: hypothetical protein COA78_00915 [Blastopirellula sp.]|nr:MAG: hypothetical protein COA78_00915 [Blastopirellula sp.]
MRSTDIRTLAALTVMLFAGLTTPLCAADDAESVAAFVGRINSAGYKNRSSCSGFQLQGGHVVTAAHCIPPLKQDAVYFVRGYRQGTYTELQTTRSGDFALAAADDLAVLCGADPLTPGLTVAATPPSAEHAFSVFGYGSPRVHSLTVSSCRFLGWNNASQFYLDCPLPPGTSGGAVVIQLENEWQIVGVVSASSKTLSRAVWINPQTIRGFCPSSD